MNGVGMEQIVVDQDDDDSESGKAKFISFYHFPSVS